MSYIVIDGVRRPVYDVRITASRDNSGGTDPIPLAQMAFTLPLEHDTALAKWALAPDGPYRYKWVQLFVQDPVERMLHIWSMVKAVVEHHEEVDNPVGVGNPPESEFYYRLIVRGTLQILSGNGEGPPHGIRTPRSPLPTPRPHGSPHPS